MYDDEDYGDEDFGGLQKYADNDETDENKEEPEDVPMLQDLCVGDLNELFRQSLREVGTKTLQKIINDKSLFTAGLKQVINGAIK